MLRFFIFATFLSLFLIQSIESLPLDFQEDQIIIISSSDSSSSSLNDPIAVIPSLTKAELLKTRKHRYHTVSCFQDITPEEELAEIKQELLLEDVEDYEDYFSFQGEPALRNKIKKFWERITTLLEKDDQSQFYLNA